MREILRGAGEIEKRSQRRKDGVPANAAGALGLLSQVEERRQGWGVLPAAVAADDLQAVRHEKLRAFVGFNGFAAQGARFAYGILGALNQHWDHDRTPFLATDEPTLHQFVRPEAFSLRRRGRSRRRPSWNRASRRSALLAPRLQSGRLAGCPTLDTAPG